MNKYEIVFIDIDGTLRNSEGLVSEENKNIIKTITSKGIKVVLATGRSCSYAKKVCEEVGTSEYLISSNGSEVINRITNEVIFQKPISKDNIRNIYQYCKSKDLNLLVNTIKQDYQSKPESNQRKTIDDINDILSSEVNQIVITSMNYDRMLIIPNMFSDKYPDIKINSTSLELLKGNRHPKKDYYHDINVEHVSKATGVAELLDYLNISPENCIAIGDSFNDISMIELCGLGVAMGNATEALKEVSNYVTDTNDNDGVAKIIKSAIIDNC